MHSKQYEQVRCSLNRTLRRLGSKNHSALSQGFFDVCCPGLSLIYQWFKNGVREATLCGPPTQYEHARSPFCCFYWGQRTKLPSPHGMLCRGTANFAAIQLCRKTLVHHGEASFVARSCSEADYQRGRAHKLPQATVLHCRASVLQCATFLCINFSVHCCAICTTLPRLIYIITYFLPYVAF